MATARDYKLTRPKQDGGYSGQRHRAGSREIELGESKLNRHEDHEGREIDQSNRGTL